MPGDEHRVGINEGTWGSNKGGARKSVNFCSDTYKIACFWHVTWWLETCW